jgi:transcriptional repressor NrdR
MKCPFCAHGDSKVVDSRDSETGEAIRRRRECLACTKRFTTYERVEAQPLFVVKKDGRREEWSHPKLLGGLISASKKRDIAPATLEAIVDDIENLVRTRNSSEIPSRDVGEMVMERLRDLDEIVYMRFASVYRSFRDVEDMRKTIEEVLAHPRPLGGGRRSRHHADESTGVLDLGK